MGRVSRERMLVNILIAVGTAFIVDQSVLRPYLDERDAQVAQRDAGFRAVELGKLTLQQEKDLRHFLSGEGASMLSDSAAVEGQVLHLVHDWEQQTGISNLSFQRTTAIQEHGFTRLTFNVTANGAIGPIAGLIYRVESSPVPLRIENTSIHPRSGAGEELQVNLSISALCQGKTQPPPATAPSDETQVSEARP